MEEAMQALEKLSKQWTISDLILLDIEMPVLDGWGFMNEWKQVTTISKNTNLYIKFFAIEDKQKRKQSRHFRIYVKTNKYGRPAVNFK
jgi:CheY-like chemotaxis protein